MVDLNQFWQEGPFPSQPLTDAQLKQAEARLGVTLPPLLVEALKIQNGGQVRDEGYVLWPAGRSGSLGSVQSVADLFGEDEFLMEAIEEDWGDPERMIAFGAGEESECCLALDYNDLEPGEEPEVVWIDQECSDCDPTGQTFEQFMNELLAADDEPAVDWHQAEQLPVLAEEVMELFDEDLGPRTYHQKLCDAEDRLLLLTYLSGTEHEELTRAEILKPLDPDECLIDVCRPEPKTCELMLASVGSEDEKDFTLLQVDEAFDDESFEDEEEETATRVVLTISRRRSDGRWKNTVDRMAPFAGFQSADREKLKQLRRNLLGREPSPEALAEEDWLNRVSELSPQELERVMPQMLMRLFDQAEQMGGKNALEMVPEEYRPFLEQILQMRDRLRAELKKEMGDSPELDIEVSRLMKGLYPDS